MKTAVRTSRLALSLYALVVPCVSSMQHQPLARRFTAGAEERYRVSLQIKAQSHSVTIETVEARTYVTPRLATAEVRLSWKVSRKITLVQPDGVAHIEEHFELEGRPSQGPAPQSVSTDQALQKSLQEFCSNLWKSSSISYTESPLGAVKESDAVAFPSLGESAPVLLALWLRRAIRPSVILPTLPFEVGASARNSLQPMNAAMSDAHGSETTAWLDAPGETPAASLHVVQQLAWKSPNVVVSGAVSAQESAARRSHAAAFFADSLTTISLLDGGVLRANRTASRTDTHDVEPVPGLPDPPDFSSKLTISVAIERIP